VGGLDKQGVQILICFFVFGEHHYLMVDKASLNRHNIISKWHWGQVMAWFVGMALAVQIDR
jgi:hypothetical protein